MCEDYALCIHCYSFSGVYDKILMYAESRVCFMSESEHARNSSKICVQSKICWQIFVRESGRFRCWHFLPKLGWFPIQHQNCYSPNLYKYLLGNALLQQYFMRLCSDCCLVTKLQWKACVRQQLLLHVGHWNIDNVVLFVWYLFSS